MQHNDYIVMMLTMLACFRSVWSFMNTSLWN